MSLPADFHKCIDDLEEQERVARLRKESYLKQTVVAHCPIKVGDVRTVGRTALAHVGRQAIVTRRSMRHNGTNWVWRLTGHVLNKNGTAPQRVAEWDEYIEGVNYSGDSHATLHQPPIPR